MKIIDKIEIKHFRSFDGGKLQPKVEIIDLNDVNIFSGANDTGKSNILRALNLFFNDEISPGVKFSINRDLCVVQEARSSNIANKKRKDGEKDVRQKDLWVKIKIHFLKDSLGMLPKKFFVEKTWDKNGLNLKRNSNIETRYKKEKKMTVKPNQKNALEGQLTQFLNKIQFEYIPTIKDRNFFNYLFSKLQNYLFEKEGEKVNKFKTASKEFNKILKDETINLFEDFQESTGVQANFNIPSTLIDFFRTLAVNTENNISLFDRGDGIQARFIPEILSEISRNSRKNIIWGFEEPENSFESKNIRKLRDDFLNKYSLTKQIFLTTHSKEILASEGDNISIYRVFKSTDNTSQVDKFIPGKGFDKERINEKFWGERKNTTNNAASLILNEVYNDLGIIEDSRIIEDLQQKLLDQEKLINESKLSNIEKEKISRKLNSKIQVFLTKLAVAEQEILEYKKPSVFFEDELLQIYKIAWLKLNNQNCSIDNFEKLFNDNAPFKFGSKNGSINLKQFLDSPSISEWEGKKILGVFDFDSAFNQFNGLNGNRWDPILGNPGEGLSRKRKETQNFYSILLPVPSHRESYANLQLKASSRLEIELFFTDKVLGDLDSLGEELVAGGSPIKIFKGDKQKFWKKLFLLSPTDFISFDQLFKKINSLLNL